jgi:hypothetical protein
VLVLLGDEVEVVMARGDVVGVYLVFVAAHRGVDHGVERFPLLFLLHFLQFVVVTGEFLDFIL